MGYIVLPPQLEQITTLANKSESLELLWLPGGIQLTVWTHGGRSTIHLINEDGMVVKDGSN